MARSPEGNGPYALQHLGLHITQFFGVFRFGGRALELVWTTSRGLTIILAVSTLVAGVSPAVAAYIGQLIVDAVIRLAAEGSEGKIVGLLWLLAAEGAVVALIAAAQAAIQVCQSLLRSLLGQRVNVIILEKALSLRLQDFEDSEFYDKLTRARREASARPLSLVNRTFNLIQNAIALSSFAVLLWQFSPWAVAIITVAGLPAFFSETKFSGDAFTLFRWRSPETRKRMYLETVMAREDFAKEVKLNRLGSVLLQRYRAIFEKIFGEERILALRRGIWGLLFALVGTVAYYGAYAWIALSAVAATITIGQMTMYLLVFKQGQAAVSAALSAISGMYEDNLYLSNLYEYLEQAVPEESGQLTTGETPGDGVRFESVTFAYPGTTEAVLNDISFHLKPGETLALVGENGSGKTTLIKLLARLYTPDAGRIILDGTPLGEWEAEALQQRIGVIFQDFARYQFLVGENIGSGDVDYFEDRERWREAAQKGMSDLFIDDMPDGYETQLGRWFKGGRELSGGQWQKIALSRAFMRQDADILVLDEPTAAMDAAAEADVYHYVRGLSKEKIVILISHRFSTVRMANQILVIHNGSITERGNHDELMANQGEYARLFTLQAQAYYS